MATYMDILMRFLGSTWGYIHFLGSTLCPCSWTFRMCDECFPEEFGGRKKYASKDGKKKGYWDEDTDSYEKEFRVKSYQRIANGCCCAGCRCWLVFSDDDDVIDQSVLGVLYSYCCVFCCGGKGCLPKNRVQTHIAIIALMTILFAMTFAVFNVAAVILENTIVSCSTRTIVLSILDALEIALSALFGSSIFFVTRCFFAFCGIEGAADQFKEVNEIFKDVKQIKNLVQDRRAEKEEKDEIIVDDPIDDQEEELDDDDDQEEELDDDDDEEEDVKEKEVGLKENDVEKINVKSVKINIE